MKYLFLVVILMQKLILFADKQQQSVETGKLPEEEKPKTQITKQTSEKTQDASKKAAKKKSTNNDDDQPWFVGTLLAPFAENVEPGKLLVEPYLYLTRQYGAYNANSTLVNGRNDHLYSGILYMETGITKKIDITLVLQGTYIHTRGKSTFHLNDTLVELGFQIAKDKKGTWIPDVRVLFSESFPTGKYDHLDPAMQYADSTGSGSFETSLTFVVRKIFYTRRNHAYNWNFSILMSESSKVSVNGLSAYGGGRGTHGIVRPGEQFVFNLAYEYKFNKNWGWGTDIHYEYQNRSSFQHHGEHLFRFRPGSPSSNIFSLAPEIEYNFSANLGIQGGLWFSLAGRNAFAFLTGFFTVSYQF